MIKIQIKQVMPLLIMVVIIIYKVNNFNIVYIIFPSIMPTPKSKINTSIEIMLTHLDV